MTTVNTDHSAIAEDPSSRSEAILIELHNQLTSARLRYSIKATFFLILQIVGWIAVLFWLYLFVISFSISVVDFANTLVEFIGSSELQETMRILNMALLVIRITLFSFICFSMGFIYLAGKVRKRGRILQPFIDRLEWEKSLR